MKLKYLFFLLMLTICACQNKFGDFVCTPCDLPCDTLFFSKPGTCPHCKMNLIHKDDLEDDSDLIVNEVKFNVGSDRFLVEGGFEKARTLKVHYHKPENFTVDSKVIVVLPGAGRNGRDYRDAWINQSEKHGLLVLALEYSEEDYPGFWSYNLAGMIEEVNTQEMTFKINSKKEEWIFGDFDRIFNLVKNELNLTNQKYNMFGHSAGGQILHRMALFYPENNADKILAANSGWYTMPTDKDSFPYGIKDFGLKEKQMNYSSNLIVFLGEKDDEQETRGHLRRSPEVDKQGLHRLARGKYFFNNAKKMAISQEKPFHWNLEIVPNVGHDYEEMSKHAAIKLYGAHQ